MEMEKVEAIQARLRILALGGSDQAVIRYGAVAGLEKDWAMNKSKRRWDDLMFAVRAAEAWMIFNGHASA